MKTTNTTSIAIIDPFKDIDENRHKMDAQPPPEGGLPCLYVQQGSGKCEDTGVVFAGVGDVRNAYTDVAKNASMVLQEITCDRSKYRDLARTIADGSNGAIFPTMMSALTNMAECPADENLQTQRAYSARYTCMDLTVPQSNATLPAHADGNCDFLLTPLSDENTKIKDVCNALWYCVKDYRPEEELATPAMLDTENKMMQLYSRGLMSYTGSGQGSTSIQARLTTYIPSLDFVLEKIKTFQVARQMFVSSGGSNERTTDLRNLCASGGTSFPTSPKELFYHVYSYACGSQGSARACESSDFGTCTYGVKKDISLSLFDSDEIREFQKWILSTLVELIYAQTSCLPSNEATCSPIADNERIMERQKMLSALDEVIANIQRAEECAEEQETEFNSAISPSSSRRLRELGEIQRELQSVNAMNSTVNSTRKLVGCVQDPFSNRIDRSNSAYAQGQLTNLDIGEFEATNQVEFALSVASDISSGLGDVLGGFADDLNSFGAFAGAMGGAGAILSVVSAFVGNTADDITQALIKSLFAEQNAKLDRFGENVNFQFSQLRQFIGDAILDDAMTYLDRQYATFSDYRNAGRLNFAEANNTNFYEVERANGGLIEKYKKQFRFSCNELKYRPEDIVQFLYGHVCGDAVWDENRCQKSKKGSLAGDCKFGRKQASYLFDEYRKSSDCDAEDGSICENASALYLQNFQNWILGAMSQAIFLQAVCIPLDEKQCPTLDDPIFDARYSNSINAYEEALANIQGAISCNCPCKRVRLSEIYFGGSDAGDHAEVRIAINGETRFPCSFSTIGRTGPEPGSPSENPGNKDFCMRGSSVCIYDDGNIGSYCKGIRGEEGPASRQFNAYVPIKAWYELIAPIELGVFTEASSPFSVSLEENDFGGNDYFNDWMVNFRDDLYSNTCEKYERVLSQNDDTGDTWRFKFEIVSVSNSECPASFCSDEFLDCDEVSFCNTTAYTCLPKKGYNEICGGPSQCLSNECLNGQCGQLKPAGEFCVSDAQCQHFNVSAPGSVGDIFRCTNETGTGMKCGGIASGENCTDSTECFSTTCDSSTQTCDD